MATDQSNSRDNRDEKSPGAKDPQTEKPELSPSSKFNIKMMWRMNYLSITIFVIALIYYIIKHI